ncbi:MAG: glycosyltransferase family 4 protein [Planctomycetota bacterium]
MLDEKQTVVFLAFDLKFGLTYHLTQAALGLARAMQQDPARLIVCSSAGEQNPGLWDALRRSGLDLETVCLEDGIDGLEPFLRSLVENGHKIVVHTQGFQQLRRVKALRLGRPRQVRTVLAINSFSHRTRGKRLVKSLWMSIACRRYCDYVMFLSPYAADLFAASGGLFSRGRAGFLPLGVEPMRTDDGPGQPDHPVGRPDLRPIVKEDTFRLVYLANLTPGKRHDWLIRSAARVLAERPHLRLLLLGDRPLAQPLARQVDRMGLSGRILLPGRIDRADVAWLLGNCQAGIVPSGCETFGHNYVEPMSAALPVIGTRTGIGKALIQDFITGLGVRDGDVEGLARAMAWLAENPEQAAEMGRNAARLVDQNNDWQSICQGYRRLYHYLLAA